MAIRIARTSPAPRLRRTHSTREEQTIRAGALGMKRRAQDEHRLRVRHQVASGLALALAACLGCMNPILRQQSPEARLDLPPTPDVPLIAEYTHPYGMDYTKIEAVSLVT